MLVLAVLVVIISKKLKISLTKLQVLIGSGALLALGILLYIFKYHDQLRLVISKFLYTFMEPYYSVLTTQVISGTSTVAIPAWFYPIQYGALILLFLSYTKEQVPRWFAWLGLLINLINLLVYYLNLQLTQPLPNMLLPDHKEDTLQSLSYFWLLV